MAELVSDTTAILLYESLIRTVMVSVLGELDFNVHGQVIEPSVEEAAENPLPNPPAVKVPLALAPYQAVELANST